MGGFGGGGMNYYQAIARAAGALLSGIGKTVAPAPYTMGQPQAPQLGSGQQHPFQLAQMATGAGPLSGQDVAHITDASSPAAGGIPVGVTVAGPRAPVGADEAAIMFPKGMPASSATAQQQAQLGGGGGGGGNMIADLVQAIIRRMGQ